MFDRFYRGDKARGGDGSANAGLGLAIAAEAARRHRGRLTLERGPRDVGTAAVMVLPRRE